MYLYRFLNPIQGRYCFYSYINIYLDSDFIITPVDRAFILCL
jgi:hypothetical protein